jgi:hypothetical protein
MWRNASVVVVAVLVAAALPASTDPGMHSVSIYDGMLTIDIPGDWMEIDPLDLEELFVWAADSTAGRLVEVYQYGFRPQNSETDPLLPHIRVQIRESGRLRYGDFLHLQPLDELQSDARKTYPQGIPPFLMGVAVEGVSFDSSTFCLRLEHSLELRFRGRVRVLSAAFFTERGLVTLHFVDRERRIEEGRTLFDQILSSVEIAPELAYRPRMSDHWPGLPFFVAAGVMAAALLAFLVHRRRLKS